MWQGSDRDANLLSGASEPHPDRIGLSFHREMPSLQRHWEPDRGGSFGNFLEGSFFLITS